MTATQLTQKFADAKKGVISYTAQYALKQGGSHPKDFLKEMHKQLTVDAPESCRRLIGDHLADSLLEHFKNTEDENKPEKTN